MTLEVTNLPPSILWFPHPANTTRPLRGKEEEKTKCGGKKKKNVIFYMLAPAEPDRYKNTEENQCDPQPFSLDLAQLEAKAIIP